MATTAGAPPGSGANFAALKGKLAGRGVRNPGALAAWIGRRKYGRKGFSKLSAMGRAHSHSSDGGSAMLDFAGGTSRCPNCGYQADDAEFAISGGASGTSVPSAPGELRTPANSGLQGAAGFKAGHGLNVRGASSGNMGLANGGGAVELGQRTAVTSPWDLVISRGDDGAAIVRHRRGGTEIGQIRKDEVGRYVATIGGQDLAPRVQQRAALMDLLGHNNSAAGTAYHRPAGEPLQPPPVQTPLMEAYGIPAVRAFATPADGAGDGPRVTASGLSDRGKGIYAKLRKRGFPHERAQAFARRAQTKVAGKFG